MWKLGGNYWVVSMPWKLYGNYQPVDSAWFPRGFHFMETPFFAQWMTEFVDDKAHTGFRVCHTILTEYVGDKAHTDFYTPCLSYNTDRVCWWKSTYRFPCLSYNADIVCWWQSTYRFLHAVFVIQYWQSLLVTKHIQVSVFVIQYWQSMLVTKHIQISTRRVCRTILTEYVGYKEHTDIYTPCLSYNADRVCWLQRTYRYLHAVFVVQNWQSMLVTKHIQISTHRVCRTMLTEYVGYKAHTDFYTPCLSYNADRVCWLHVQNTCMYRFLHAVFVVQYWQCIVNGFL